MEINFNVHHPYKNNHFKTLTEFAKNMTTLLNKLMEPFKLNVIFPSFWCYISALVVMHMLGYMNIVMCTLLYLYKGAYRISEREGGGGPGYC